MVGIARRIAAFGQRGLVASLLQLEISDALSFVSAFHPPSLSFQRLDGHRFHDQRISRAIAASIREPPIPGTGVGPASGWGDRNDRPAGASIVPYRPPPAAVCSARR